MAPGRKRARFYRQFVLNGDDDLTPWEKRVLRLVADGWTSPRLAKQFGKSVGLFEQTRTSLYRKLGAVNAANAVKLGFERGLLVASPRR